MDNNIPWSIKIDEDKNNEFKKVPWSINVNNVSTPQQVAPWTIDEFKPVTYPDVKKDAYLISRTGKCFSLETNRFLTEQSRNTGYKAYGLVTDQENRSQKYQKIFPTHRLVAWEFCDPPEDYQNMQVNHIIPNKHFNYDTNLEWVSDEEHRQHTTYTELMPKGENNAMSCLSDNQVHQICQLLQDTDLSSFEIFEKLNLTGFDNQTIKNIVTNINTGRTWGHISQYYNLKRKNAERLTKEEVIDICERLERNQQMSDISRELGIKSCAVVEDIKNRKNYTEYSKDYNFDNYTGFILDRKQIEYVCQKLSEGWTVPEIYEDVMGEKWINTRAHKQFYRMIMKIKNRLIFNDITDKYNF